jgi:hypothetical protein
LREFTHDLIPGNFAWLDGSTGDRSIVVTPRNWSSRNAWHGCRRNGLIRWGFYYESDREGDFIILGPTGGVLVLEVKGGELRKLSTTGRWEGPGSDHPLAQLLAEWHAIIERLQEAAAGNVVPFVAKALCLPNVEDEPTSPAERELYFGEVIPSLMRHGARSAISAKIRCTGAR